jgi:hypothetical protein
VHNIFLVIVQIVAMILIIKWFLSVYLNFSRQRMEEEYNLSAAQRYIDKFQDCLDNRQMDEVKKSLEIRLYSTAILKIINSDNSVMATKEVNDFFYRNNINISCYKLPEYSLN